MALNELQKKTLHKITAQIIDVWNTKKIDDAEYDEIRNLLWDLESGKADNSNENSGLHKHVVNARFSSENELRTFIQMHLPIAIKPTKPAKTMFVGAFTSANAEKVVVDCLVEAFLNGR